MILNDEGSSAWPYPNVVLHASVVTCVSVVTLLTASRYFAIGSTSELAQENGPLELLQVGLLAVAALIGCLSIRSTKTSRWRTILIAIVAMGWVACIRETPSTTFTALLGTDIQPKDVKHTLMGLGVVVLVTRAIYAWWSFPADRRLWFSPQFIWPIVPFAVCFVVSQVCEQMNFVFIEETAEIAGYSMLLCTAVWIRRSDVTTRQESPQILSMRREIEYRRSA